MKENRKTTAALFAAGILGATAAVLLRQSSLQSGSALPAFFAFPFAPLGRGLRTLSLQGVVWNLLAWAGYLLLCLLPPCAAWVLRRLGRGCKAALLLAGCGALLVPVMYWMINPGVMTRWFNPLMPIAMGQAVCGATVWCCLLAWFVLRLLQSLPRHTVPALAQQLNRLLFLLALRVLLSLCGVELYELFEELDALTARNTALSARELLPSRIFLVLQYLTGAVPSLLTVCVLQKGRCLLQAAQADHYSETTVTAAQALATICRRTVTLSALITPAFALAQLLFAPLLQDLQSNLTLPLGEIALALAALVLANWMAETKALKDENEAFI